MSQQLSDIAEEAFEKVKALPDYAELTQEERDLMRSTMRAIQDLTLKLPTLSEEKRQQIQTMDLKMAKDTLADIGIAKGLRIGKRALGILSELLISALKIGLAMI